ncbi:dethiobiotin synthase [Prosthecobacter sp.]|uniref:dethiobiotin synthase n=1 Tax=Prosthecobacter sp. TaxID=1965333 RepID=UPI0025CF83C3|nr:dethiobiotin synthase [Prosthecobacter sp.]
MSHYFITGTDTDAGKTYVTCLLLEALKSSGKNVAGFKPFVCGSRDDAIHLANASSEGLTVEEVNPVWFKVPAAPYAAALMENRRIELNDVMARFQELAQRHDHVLVEGAGGWEVPLNEFSTMADFAQRLALPVIVVVNNKLGCLNHTLLTVRNIQARGLTCAGIILNYVKEERDAASISNRMVLEHFMDVPVLAEIMHGETEIEWPL